MTLSKTMTFLLITGVVTLSAGSAIVAMEPELGKIHRKIVSDYQHVEHIDGQGFEALDPSELVVFDVREPAEFDVSHLEGAIQIDPGIRPEAFMDQFGDAISGKTIVFYCSVGRRSSNLAERLDTVLAANGNDASYNLTGGLFQWHNEDRPVMTETGGTTRAIHPYNNHWGRLIDDKAAISYRPEAKAGPE